MEAPRSSSAPQTTQLAPVHPQPAYHFGASIPLTQSAVAVPNFRGHVTHPPPRRGDGCIGCQSLGRARTAPPGAVLKHQTEPKRCAAKTVLFWTGRITVTPNHQALAPSPDLVSNFQAHPKNRVDQEVFYRGGSVAFDNKLLKQDCTFEIFQNQCFRKIARKISHPVITLQSLSHLSSAGIRILQCGRRDSEGGVHAAFHFVF